MLPSLTPTASSRSSFIGRPPLGRNPSRRGLLSPQSEVSSGGHQPGPSGAGLLWPLGRQATLPVLFHQSHTATPQQPLRRRSTITNTTRLHLGKIDTRTPVHIAKDLFREEDKDASMHPETRETPAVAPQEEPPRSPRWKIIPTIPQIVQDHLPPPLPDEFTPPFILSTESRRTSKGTQQKIILSTPMMLEYPGDEGKIVIDHVTARWDGVPPLPGGGFFREEGDDGTSEDNEEEGEEEKSWKQKSIKYIKILTPHIILVSVLIGYLCLGKTVELFNSNEDLAGAWILMLLETKTELQARSRKLVKLTNMVTNYTIDSWKIINDAQKARKFVHEDEWARIFREYMVSSFEVVDDRRPIRKELNRPDDMSNMHNKWTFPTSLLYVLTVLTTCGYGEVSVDTDSGKVFSVAFALIGIPLMFITGADVGKFLSDTLLKFVLHWNRMTRHLKEFFCRNIRRKSVISSVGDTDTIDVLGMETEEKLWFPIGAYVGCICLYCSLGSVMFMNWERKWSFIHAFHFGFNLMVTVGLGDIVVVDYLFLSLIVAFVIVGLAVMTMCVDLASTHLKAYFTRIHYFGRAKRFLGMSEELREIVALLSAMRRKHGGKITWNDIRNFLVNELRDRPFEPYELLKKLKYIDETSSVIFNPNYYRDSEYIRRVTALRPEHPTFA